MCEINISTNGIKQAIDDLVNENELLQDKVYKQNEEIERLQKCYCERTDCAGRIKNSAKFPSIQEEIERLNNIINELERYINEEYIYDELGMKIFDASKLQDKLQELKGSE